MRGRTSGKLAFFTTNQGSGIKRGFLSKYLSSAGFVFSFNIGLLALYLLSFNGCKGRQIIRVTPQMNIESPFWVRVLLADNVEKCQLGVRSSFRVFNEEKGVSEGYFDGFSGGAEISVEEGLIVIGRQRFEAGKITILPDSPHVFRFSGDVYRGKLRLEVKADGQSFSVINVVPLEPYLAGVVGAEMPNYWEPSALESQAIAARTYCLYIKNRFGGGRSWDVSRSQSNQVYRGVGAESAQVWNAVNATFGQVLYSRYPNGREDLFPAYYSSTCGGHTEASVSVWGESFGPLVGVPCPYCEGVAKPKYFFWPMVGFDKATVASRLVAKYPKLKKLGEISDIVVSKESKYGSFSRLTRVKVAGSGGKSDFIRAEDLRMTLDPTGRKFRSTICEIIDMGDKWAFISGRGWGHGVGMCQCGAQGMARLGRSSNEILSYYYPGSKVVSTY